MNTLFHIFSFFVSRLTKKESAAKFNLMLTLQGGSFLSLPPYFLAYNLVKWRLRVNFVFLVHYFYYNFFFFTYKHNFKLFDFDCKTNFSERDTTRKHPKKIQVKKCYLVLN